MDAITSPAAEGLQSGAETPSQPEQTQPKRMPFTGIQQLTELFIRYDRVSIKIPGSEDTLEFELRGLTQAEHSKIDELNVEAGVPRLDKKTGQPDFDDPEYIKRKRLVAKKKNAMVLLTAVKGFDLPGDTLEAKAEVLANAVPPRVLDALLEQVVTRTVDPLVLANFTGGNGESGSQN